jgi:tripartite-type tricarboxylate transporter receptor subunit TctC
MQIKSLRRSAVMLLASLAGFIVPLAGASAQSFPNKPIRLIVGSSPGGGGDIVARIVAPRLSKLLGQPVVIENRAAAGGNIGAALVAKAAPDGHTLLLAYTGHVMNPGLYGKLPFDTVRDFAPVARLDTTQTVLVVNPSLPIKSVQELIAYAKAHPDKLSMGGLPGSSSNMAGELFKSMAGIDILSVPYKGNSEALTALLSGEIVVMFNTMTIVSSHVRSGKMRALATAGKARSQLMPELPTISEVALPGFSAEGWHGIIAPAKTPDAVVEQIHQALRKVMDQPDVRTRMAELGNEPVVLGPSAFSAFIQDEIPRWVKVIADAHIKSPDL